MGSALSMLTRSGGARQLVAACVRVVMENQYLAGMLVMAAGPALAQSLWAVSSHSSRLAAGGAWTRVTIGKAEAEDLREWLRSQPRLHNGSNLKLCPRSDADSDSSTADQRIFDYEPELETSLRVRFRSASGRARGLGRVCSDSRRNSVVRRLRQEQRAAAHVHARGVGLREAWRSGSV
mgnify:CR=1 FL=1